MHVFLVYHVVLWTPPSTSHIISNSPQILRSWEGLHAKPTGTGGGGCCCNAEQWDWQVRHSRSYSKQHSMNMGDHTPMVPPRTRHSTVQQF